MAELGFGAGASARASQNLERLDPFMNVVKVADFDQASADIYSHLRLSLLQKRKPTGEMDLLIASVAVANKAILVTHNTQYFDNIDDLSLEDWLT